MTTVDVIRAAAHRSNQARDALSETERFFYDHASYNYDPRTETAEGGRARCARDLAAAEARLHAGPYGVDHVPDPEPYESEVPYDGPVWVVRLWSFAGSADGKLIGSIGSVGCADGSAYLRVVAAELAHEHIPA